MKALKRAFILVLVLALAIIGIAIISAVDNFPSDKKFTYNGNEYSSERPTGEIQKHYYYVGGPNGSDTNNGLDKETPFATLNKAINAAKSAKYLDTSYQNQDTFHETIIVLVGDTNETALLPQITGGILTVIADEGVDATINVGTSNSNVVAGNFFNLKPGNNGANPGYMELNLGTADMKGTITFDCTYYSVNAVWSNAYWGGFVRIGDESWYSNIICNMYDGITIKNIYNYDSNTNNYANGAVIHVDCGTFNMYGGTFTQNRVGRIIGAFNRNGAGAYIYGGEISNNIAAPFYTQIFNTNGGKIFVYDCLVQNNYNASADGAIEANNAGDNSNIVLYGGTFKNNVGKSNYFANANGNIYRSDLATVQNETFTDYVGNEHTPNEGLYKGNNYFDITSKVFYAKDGSARAFGYCLDKDLILCDGVVGGSASFENVQVAIDDYVYSKPKTNSCVYYLKDVKNGGEIEYGGLILVNKDMTSGMYCFNEEVKHNFIQSDHKDPTANEAGYDEYTCPDCGDSYRDLIEPAGHEHDYEEFTFEVTCVENGYTLYRCRICQYEYQSDVVLAEGHDFNTVEVFSTCLAAGYKTVTCNKCDYRDHTDYPILEDVFVLEKTYPVNIYRCINGCNKTKQKVYVSYYSSTWGWSDPTAFDGTYASARYNVEVEIGTKIIVGKKLDGSDITHANDSVDATYGEKKFFGWHTDQGVLYEYGKEITIESNMAFYEAVGYIAEDEENLGKLLRTGAYVKLNADITTDSKIGLGNSGGLRAILDLNGHDITVNNDYVFSDDRSGIIILGKGTITQNASKPANGWFYGSKVHGYGDSTEANRIHTLWIGQDVTVKTNARLYNYNNNGNLSIVPILRIAGTVEADYLFYGYQGMVQIYPTAKVTLNNTYYKYMAYVTSGYGFNVNIYGGEINFPTDMVEDYFTQNPDNSYNYSYQISGGIFNTRIPAEYVYDGHEIYYNSKYSNNYFVVPNCTKGDEHEFSVSSTADCFTDGKTILECACGVKLEFTEAALGHNHDGFVKIIYPNGFDKVGYGLYICSRCEDKQTEYVDEEDIHDAIIIALGYSVDYNGTAIMGGYKVNYDALDAYESFSGTKLEYGILFVNVNNENVTSIDFINGIIQTSNIAKAIQAECIDEIIRAYETFKFTVSGFNPTDTTYADLEIVIAGYVVEREKLEDEEQKGAVVSVSFVQSDRESEDEISAQNDSSIYNKSVTVNGTGIKDGTTLSAVSLRRLYANSDYAGQNDPFTPKSEDAGEVA